MKTKAKRVAAAAGAMLAVAAVASSIQGGVGAYRAAVDSSLPQSIPSVARGLAGPATSVLKSVAGMASATPQDPESVQTTADTGLAAAVGKCPLAVAGGIERSWRQNAAGSSWLYDTEEPMGEVASSALHALENDGWELVEAGYLGIDDRSWGCVAQRSDAVVMLFGIPARLDDGATATRVTVVELPCMV